MSDYMFILESHLDAAQSRAVTEIQRLATEAGMNAWLTGGAMRDVLRGSRILDLDFTVEHDAVKIGKQLAAALSGKVIADDPLKRWVELELPGSVRASVSNARTEKYSKPGGKPQIEASTIREDLLRRDFTINSIGLSLNRGSRGLLIDPANGQADILSKELRATSPYIFFDDPRRIFRMIRFQHSLGYEVTPRLRSQLENALLEGYQEHAPASALAAEIRALGGGQNAVLALEEYDRCELLKVISKQLTGAKLNAAGLTKLEKLATSLPSAATTGGWLAFLNILLQKLSTKERADALNIFELPKDEADALKRLDAQAKKLESALKAGGMVKPSVVYEAVSAASFDEVLMALYTSSLRNVQDRIHAYYEKYLPMSLEVTEEQVTATGVKPGTPKFEKALKTMIAAHLNARPKKVVPEAEGVPGEPVAPVPVPPMAMGARGPRKV
jgi:tRNA nucleotidyltransferase (CCA-adding enzyme)